MPSVRVSHRHSCRALAAVLLLMGACAGPSRTPGLLTGPDAEACRSLLSQQAAAWNRGDLDAFLEGYHDGEQTVFVSADGVHLGFAATAARYARRYPDRAAMGKLSFDELVLLRLGPDTVSATGRWELHRDDDAPHGRYSLVLRRFPAGWSIVLDYTTSADPDAREEAQTTVRSF